jgi:hypothetical protein
MGLAGRPETTATDLMSVPVAALSGSAHRQATSVADRHAHTTAHGKSPPAGRHGYTHGARAVPG